MNPARIVALATCFALSIARSFAAPQECDPSWLPTFGASHGIPGGIHAFAVLDDGVGASELFIGGGAPASGVSRFDGERFEYLGSLTHTVVASLTTLAVFDDGSGPAVYAGGSFTTAGGVAASRVARWDGASWSPLGSGTNGTVEALCVHDDGSGPALYAGGSFTFAGGVEVNRVARWDGTSWTALAGGMNGTVQGLAVFDDGSGAALYAAGSFTLAGGVAANRIARWDGTSWTALGSGMASASVSTLAVFDDGSGSALYAGGGFTVAGGVTANRIARWDGTSWTAVGTGMNSSVTELAVFDDGGGQALFAGGAFATAGGVSAARIARWNGTAWSALGSGTSASVSALIPYDNGNTTVLLVGGGFLSAGGVPVDGLASWSGTSWAPFTHELLGPAYALAEFDDGSGAALHVGGSFAGADGVAMNSVGRWDEGAWSPLGSGMNNVVRALTVFDDGSGPALYAGGLFSNAGGAAANRIARWDGASWTPLSSGTSGTVNEVNALAVFDEGSGPALYAGGRFTAAGGVSASSIARWDGSAWSALGSGSGINGYVLALAVYDDGSGPALYAGGFFAHTLTGERNLARWDGTSWSAVGAGFTIEDEVHALAVFDSGSGPALHVGGLFPSAGGIPTGGIARFDGSNWAPLGTGLIWPGTVLALAPLGSGSGARLFVGGAFPAAGGVSASNVASWDGANWAPLGEGQEDSVHALLLRDDGDGSPALVAGGSFRQPVGGADAHLALWDIGPDQVAPVLSCPTSLLVHDSPTSPPGAVVHFTVLAEDACDPSPAVVCDPPSGSFFPRGTTVVSCTATDADGNASVCEFPVTVQLGFRKKL